MQKSKALELFLQKEVKVASQGFVLRTMDYLKKEKALERKKEFVKNFQIVMSMCTAQPEEPRFLQVTLVRSKALLLKPFFILEVFPEGLYLTEPEASIEMDLWWLYHEYGQFCEEIDREARKYVQCLDKMILDRIKLAELAECRMIIKYLFQGTVAAIIDTEEYIRLNPGEGFQIQLGEYRGPYEIMFQSNQYAERVGRWWNGIL